MKIVTGPIVCVANRCPNVPRYYFHIRRGQATMLDHDGVDLVDVQDATAEAARRGRQIARADAAKGNLPASLVIVVADEQWSPVFEVLVDELVDC